MFGKCEQKCENAVGSFRCSCVDGYTTEISDGHLHCKANPASTYNLCMRKASLEHLCVRLYSAWLLNWRTAVQIRTSEALKSDRGALSNLNSDLHSSLEETHCLPNAKPKPEILIGGASNHKNKSLYSPT